MHSAPENFEIPKPYNAIFSILGTKFEDERACFLVEGNVAFILSVTQSIPRGTEQMMKIKLSTFPRKKILLKPRKKLVKK